MDAGVSEATDEGGVKMTTEDALTLEAQSISLTCRNNRTMAGAWDEAVRRLREVYDAQVQHDPGVTMVLFIARGDTVPLPEGAKQALRVKLEGESRS